MKGYFITLEGGEGSGKTTVAKCVKAKLEEDGYKVILTREPGGVNISEQIRKVIVDPLNKEMDGRTEVLLYAASRRQHLVEKIIPALEEGSIVLCDRFVDSSLVYQGIARGIGIEEVYKLNEFAINDTLPVLTLFFDVDPKIGFERIYRNKNREINRLDQESMNFHYDVYRGYLTLCDLYPERIKKVDASKDIEDVTLQVYQLIRDVL